MNNMISAGMKYLSNQDKVRQNSTEIVVQASVGALSKKMKLKSELKQPVHNSYLMESSQNFQNP